jgi:hypothetical protein
MAIGLIYGGYSSSIDREDLLSYPKIYKLKEVNAVVVSKKHYFSSIRGAYLIKLDNNLTYMVTDTLKFMLVEGSQIKKDKGEKIFTIITGNKKEYYISSTAIDSL